MKFSKLLRSAAAALLCMSLLTGCGSTGTSSDSNASESTTSSSSEDSRAETVEESTPDVTGEVSEPSSPTTPEEVTALKGPTAMGMTKLMSDDEENGYPYEFTITAATDELAPLVIQGKTDIMCCPANMASVLYNKTEGGVKGLVV